MRFLRSRAGQIVIPAMLIFPSLFLFVYLIYETAKLSREKIRHQFAMDAAAFVEMANYSDFLNRTAYVNGAFPMRIFTEGYGDFPAECEGKVQNCQKVMYADILYNNGVFPRSASGKTAFTGSDKVWDIEYGGVGQPKNNIPPSDALANQADLPGGGDPQAFWLFTLTDANKFWHPYDLATEIYKLFVQIYSLLGSVEDAQFSVLKRLSADHSFMKKSYWLNTGDDINTAAGLARSFDVALGDFNSAVHPYCISKLSYCGNKHLGGTGIQPYRPECTDPVVQLPTSQGCPQGLFQLEWVDPSVIKKLRDASGGGYPGLPLLMTWPVPGKNYWNVDFASLLARNPASSNGNLHTTISVAGSPSSTPNVWPHPTPRFQVRQFP